MRGERLLTILLHLQKRGGRLTTRELAGLLEVSERTVHRDMEALSAAGIPVYAERGSAGGWRLTEGYRTDLTGMSLPELQALLLLAGHAAPAAELGLEGPLRGALLKLSAAIPERHRAEIEAVRSKLHIDGAPWHPRLERGIDGGIGGQVSEMDDTRTVGSAESDGGPPLLRIVQEAVWLERRLLIGYRKDSGTDGSPVDRLIAPLGLVVKNGLWYVVALTDDGLRNFRISRMTRAEITDSPAIRPESFELAAYWQQSTAAFKANLPRYEAVIRFRADAWRLPLPRIRQERILRMESPKEQDGFCVAVVRFDTAESACSDILAFGDAVEVLQPEELRDMVRRRIEAMRRMYES